MQRKKNISKLLLGTFFIAIYCNVLLTQLFCNYSHLINLAGTEHEHPQGHDHHYGDETVPPVEHNDKGNHHHNDSKRDDNCCNDKTAAFFASQTNHLTTSFKFKNTFSIEFIGFSNVSNVSNPSLLNSKGYFSYESPPPKIPDIRVFTHSFLI